MKLFLLSDKKIDKKNLINESGRYISLEIESFSFDDRDIFYKKIKNEIIENKRFGIIIDAGNENISSNILQIFCESSKNNAAVFFDADLDNNPNESFFPIALNSIKKQEVQKEAVVFIGAHRYDSLGFSFFKENRLKNYSMKEISIEGKAEVSDNLLASTNKYDKLAVFIDTDVIEDPGLSQRDLIYFIQRISLLKNLRFILVKSSKNQGIDFGLKIIGEIG